MHELAKAKPIATPYTKYTASRFELGFKVSHYAGEVEYRTDGWLDKNRDPLSDPLTSLLAKSSDPYIASLFAEFVDPDPSVVVEGPRLRIKRGAYRTVGQFHRERLAALMAQLRETQPHFVRCIVPNLEKSPTRLDTPLILDQLRCNGVLEGIRIARLGYPNRLPFSDFRRRFKLITPGVVANGFVDGAQACRLVLAALEVDPLTYKIGLSKVFFKAGILADLEERRDGHLSAVFTKVQAACRKFIARRAANKILNRAAAVRTIQRNARIYGQLRAWPWWALFQRVRPLLAAARSDDEARRKEAEMVEIKEKAERDEVERARLQKVQEDLEAAQAELEASLVSERALSIERESLLRLSKEREAALEEDLALAQADLETVDGQLERAMASKAEADQRIGDLNSAFANSTQLLATLQTEQAAWKAREVDLASKTSIQTSEWDRVNSEREAGVVAIAELRRNVAEQAQDAEREHKRLVDALAAVEGRLATTSKELVDVRAKLSKLETDSRAVKEESTGLESQRKSLEAQLKERSSELTRVQAGSLKSSPTSLDF
jgi:myosin protein heavy chain